MSKEMRVVVYRNSVTENEVYKQNPLTCGLASYLQND